MVGFRRAAAAAGIWLAGMGLASAQDLPAWKIADICTTPRDSAPGYCAAFEGEALKAVSGSWAFIPEAIRKSCLASVKSLADQSWRVLGDCVDEAMERNVDARAVKTARTPGEPVPPARVDAAPAPVAVVAPAPAPVPVAIPAPAPPPPAPVVAALPPPVAGPPQAAPAVFDQIAKANAAEAAARKAASDAEARRVADADAARKTAMAASEADAKRKADAELAAKTAADAAARAKILAAGKACTDDLTALAKSGTIRFATGSARLDAASTPTLEGIAARAKTCPDVAIVIEGHTDSTGDADFNLALSKERAGAVLAYLAKAGVQLGRLKAVGLGDTKPAVDNDTSENRARNRRIEFSVGGA